MDNVRNNIWLNTNRKEAGIIFGLYYEFHNDIVYNSVVKDKMFGKVLDKYFIDYIRDNNIENIGYTVLFNNFIEDLLSKFNGIDNQNFMENKSDGNFVISSKKIFMIDISSFREIVNNIDEYYPWINIINSLELSYYDKTELIRSISNYLSYAFDTLNCFYDDKTVFNIHELITNNVINYLSNIDSDSFSFELFNKEFYDNNRNFINCLIKDNKFNLMNINSNEDDLNYISKFNKDEYKIFTSIIKESLIYGDSDRLEVESFNCIINDLGMGKFKFYCNLKSLSSKLNKETNVKRKIR